MADITVEQQLASISKRLEIATRLWGILSAAVVLLFGAGVFFANSVADYNSLKQAVGTIGTGQEQVGTRLDGLETTVKGSLASIKELSDSLSALKASLPAPYQSGDPITVSSTGTSSKSVAARYCALSYVNNNNHSESACECGLTRSGDNWTLTVKNSIGSLTCTCEASCLK